MDQNTRADRMNDVSRWLAIADYLSSNLALVSVCVTGLSLAYATAALSGYLTVFDGKLIWLFEFSDMSKLLVLGLALLSGFALGVGAFLEAIDSYVSVPVRDRPSPKIVKAFLAIMIIGGSGLSAYIERDEKGWFLPLLQGGLVVWLISSIKVFARNIRNRKVSGIARDLVFFAGLCFAVGLTYGTAVQSDGKSVRTIVVRSKEAQSETVLRGKIVVMLSHHTAVATGTFIQVIPTMDIVRIVSVARAD